MDKYEYGIKSDQIKKMVAKKDYKVAAKIADTIDWSKVKSNSMLITVADAYEANRQYDKAKQVLLCAYERTPMGRQLAYRLSILSIKLKDYIDAEDFYRDFVDMAPHDNAQYILKYKIEKGKGKDVNSLIPILEAFNREEMDEKWGYELAKLYHEVGDIESCVAQCDEISLWFNEGEYVDKAMELKKMYKPLTKGQQERYDRRFERFGYSDALVDDGRGYAGVSEEYSDDGYYSNDDYYQTEVAYQNENLYQNGQLYQPEPYQDGLMDEYATKRIGAIRHALNTEYPETVQGVEQYDNVQAPVQSPIQSFPYEDMRVIHDSYDEDKMQRELARNLEEVMNDDESQIQGQMHLDFASYTDEEKDINQLTGQLSLEEVLRDLESRGILASSTVDATVKTMDNAEAAVEEAAAESAFEAAQSIAEEEIAKAAAEFEKGLVDEAGKNEADESADEEYKEADLGEDLEEAVEVPSDESGDSLAKKENDDEDDDFIDDYMESEDFGKKKGGFKIPGFGLPKVEAPDLSVPDVDIPVVNIPGVNIPDVSVPKVDFSRPDTPKAVVPGTNEPIEIIGVAVKKPELPEKEVKLEENVELGDTRVIPDINELKNIVEEVQNEKKENAELENSIDDNRYESDAEKDSRIDRANYIIDNIPEIDMTEEILTGMSEVVVSKDIISETADLNRVRETLIKIEEEKAETEEANKDSDETSEEVKDTKPVVKDELTQTQKLVSEAITGVMTIDKKTGLITVVDKNNKDSEEKNESVKEADTREFEVEKESDLKEPEVEEKIDTKEVESEKEDKVKEVEEEADTKEFEIQTEIHEDIQDENETEEFEKLPEVEDALESEPVELDDFIEEKEEPKRGFVSHFTRLFTLKNLDIDKEDDEDLNDDFVDDYEEDFEKKEESEEKSDLDKEEEELDKAFEKAMSEFEKEDSVEVTEEAEKVEEKSEPEFSKSEEQVLDELEDEEGLEDLKALDGEEEKSMALSDVVDSKVNTIADKKAKEVEEDFAKEFAAGLAMAAAAGDIKLTGTKIDDTAEINLSEDDLKKAESEGKPVEKKPLDSVEDRVFHDEQSPTDMDDERIAKEIEEADEDIDDSNPYEQADEEDLEEKHHSKDKAIKKGGLEEQYEGFLSREEEDLFSNFVNVAGLQNKIIKTIINLTEDYVSDGASTAGNIVVMGDEKSGKTTLAIDILKTVNKRRERLGRKIAKVNAQVFNKKGISQYMQKLIGSDLIIENAGLLNEYAIEELIDSMQYYTDDMIVVLEDEGDALNRILDDYPDLDQMFDNQIVVKDYDINEWVKYAKDYAKQNNYVVDDLGTLALYARIDDEYGIRNGLSEEDIEDIMDSVMRKASHKLMRKVFGKNKNDGFNVLKEADFY